MKYDYDKSNYRYSQKSWAGIFAISSHPALDGVTPAKLEKVGFFSTDILLGV